MKAAPKFKVGDRVVIETLPPHTAYKLGQVVTISNTFFSGPNEYVAFEGAGTDEVVYSHRVRKLTPLDEELS